MKVSLGPIQFGKRFRGSLYIFVMGLLSIISRKKNILKLAGNETYFIFTQILEHNKKWLHIDKPIVGGSRGL